MGRLWGVFCAGVDDQAGARDDEAERGPEEPRSGPWWTEACSWRVRTK